MKQITLLLTLLCTAFVAVAQNEIFSQSLFTNTQHVAITNCESLIDSTVVLQFFDEEPSYEKRTIYAYDEQNRQLKKNIEYYSAVDESFQLRTTYSTEYSGSEKITFQKKYEGTVEELLPYKRMTTVMNSSDYPASYSEDSYDETFSDYGPYLKTTYIYYPNTDLVKERNVRRWNSSVNQFEPFRRDLYYRTLDENNLLDSLVVKNYDANTEMFLPASSYHQLYDNDNRLVEYSYYRAISIGADLTLEKRDSLVYAMGSDDHIIYKFATETFTSTILELNSIIHVDVENGLTIADSTFVEDNNTNDFLLESFSYYDYDEENRRVKSVFYEKLPTGNFEIKQERRDYYQACEVSSTVVVPSQVDCHIPNPIHNGQSISCALEGYKKCKLKLFDLLGRQVFESEINESIYLHLLPMNGIYFVTIEDKNRILMHQKIIVAN